VLDCPDPSTKTPRRAVTTTPLQALSLLNNSFMLRMSERLAEGAVDRDVPQLVERVLGRKPSETEAVELRAFAEQHGLPTLARVLLNSNEFLYVE
jgi:hypothetical protein